MPAPPTESIFSKSSMLGTRGLSWAEAGKATKARPTKTKIVCRNHAMGELLEETTWEVVIWAAAGLGYMTAAAIASYWNRSDVLDQFGARHLNDDVAVEQVVSPPVDDAEGAATQCAGYPVSAQEGWRSRRNGAHFIRTHRGGAGGMLQGWRSQGSRLGGEHLAYKVSLLREARQVLVERKAPWHVTAVEQFDLKQRPEQFAMLVGRAAGVNKVLEPGSTSRTPKLVEAGARFGDPPLGV